MNFGNILSGIMNEVANHSGSGNNNNDNRNESNEGGLLGMAQQFLNSDTIKNIIASLMEPIDVPPPENVNVQQAIQQGSTVQGGTAPYQVAQPYTAGKVKALFIGINYVGTSSELKGCVNDVHTMLSTLQKLSFPISETCILVDDAQFPNFTDYPTRANMIKYMGWLVSDAKPGDVLFMHYSGHGGQSKSKNDKNEAYDQSLCPVDYSTAGCILDDDLFKMLCEPIPAGVRLTCVYDCCHSASMLDLPFSFVAKDGVNGGEMENVRKGNYANADILLFSGCTDDGTSADIQGGPNGAGGAATNAFTWSLLNTTGLNYMDILLKTRNQLKTQGYKQVPQLTSSKPVDLSKTFSLFGSLEVNQQQMQQHVPQQYQQNISAGQAKKFAFQMPKVNVNVHMNLSAAGPYGGRYQHSGQGFYGDNRPGGQFHGRGGEPGRIGGCGPAQRGGGGGFSPQPQPHGQAAMGGRGGGGFGGPAQRGGGGGFQQGPPSQPPAGNRDMGFGGRSRAGGPPQQQHGGGFGSGGGHGPQRGGGGFGSGGPQQQHGGGFGSGGGHGRR